MSGGRPAIGPVDPSPAVLTGICIRVAILFWQRCKNMLFLHRCFIMFDQAFSRECMEVRLLLLNLADHFIQQLLDCLGVVFGFHLCAKGFCRAPI